MPKRGKRVPLITPKKNAKPVNPALFNQESLFTFHENSQGLDLPGWLIYVPDFIERGDENTILNFIDDWKSAAISAVDIETYTKTSVMSGALDPWQGEIRMIQVGLEDGRVLIADLGGYDDNRQERYAQLEKLGFVDALQSTMESQNHRTIGHNLQFDLLWLLHHFGINAWNVGDTMLLSQLFWAGVGAAKIKGCAYVSHSLGEVGSRVGIPFDKSEQTSNFGFPLRQSQIIYAGNDVHQLFPVYNRLLQRCKDAGLSKAYMSEFVSLPAYVDMLHKGMPVCEDTLKEVIGKYEEALDKLSEPFRETFGEYSIHENSKSVANGREDGTLMEAFRKRLGIQIFKLDRAELNPHREHPVVASYLVSKSCIKYLDYLYGVRDNLRDGAVRGGYRQCAPAGRGRSTSGKSNLVPSVNLQNPPNTVKMPTEMKALNLPDPRSVFRAPKGYAFISEDYAAAHARIAVQCAHDKYLIEAYKKDLDVHCFVASYLARYHGAGPNDEVFEIAVTEDEWCYDVISFEEIKRHEGKTWREAYKSGLELGLDQIDYLIAEGFVSTESGISIKANWSEQDMMVLRKTKTKAGKLASFLRSVSKNVYYGFLNGAGASTTERTIVEGGVEVNGDQASEVLDALKDRLSGINAFHKRVSKGIRDTSKFKWFSSQSAPYVKVVSLCGRFVWLPVWPDYENADGSKRRGGAKPTDATAAIFQNCEATSKKTAMGMIHRFSLDNPEYGLRIVNDAHDEIVCICKEEYFHKVGEYVWGAMQSTLAMFVKVIPVHDGLYDSSKDVTYSWAEAK